MGKLDEDLSGTLEQGSAEIAEHIAEKFDVDRADSVQGEIKEMLASAIQNQQQETPAGCSPPRTRAIPSSPRRCAPRRRCSTPRSATASSSPSFARRNSKENRALHAQVRELTERFSVHLERNEGDERVAEAEEAGTRKGFTFEERVHEAIERIASTRAAISATHTGGEGAEGGGKKGDVARRARRRRGPLHGPDRVRGQGPEALEERGLGRAQRGDGRAGRRRSASSSSPARTGCPPAASSFTSTRATS